MAPARLLVPATLLAWGTATFLLVSLRGFSVINRYVLVSALALMLFAAFAIAGFSRLPRGHRRSGRGRRARCWSCLAGVIYTAR